jgi:ParB family chromosome partitioning protein|tara:strand:- start:111 stop:971 length:861 start_codon:yes stop_codon:yes gene_type:complete
MKDKKRKGLGRGLSALFGDTNENENTNIIDIKKNIALISELNRNKYQPRIKFDEDKLRELSNSIKKNGVIQPIAVRKDKSESGKYEIIAGERRWIAAQKAGLHEVPIVILDLDDSEALEVAIVENIQREDLNAIEEAKGYERLKNEFKYDQDKIAELMSKSRSHISNTLRLLSLPNDIVTMIENGLITAGQARPLIGLSNASSIAEEIINKKLSARQVESLTRLSKSSVNQKQTDSNIVRAQKDIEDILGLKVIIKNSKKNSGKITIEYKGLDQFELISNLLKQQL